MIELLDDIAPINPKAASEYVDEINERVSKLQDFPFVGRKYNESFRMLIVRKYLIFYRVDDSNTKIFITSVIYGGRKLEEIIGERS